MGATLGEFTRDHQRVRPALSSRAAAGVLTTLLYAGLLMFWQQRDFRSIPYTITLPATVMRLSPDRPQYDLPVPPVMAHLLKPRLEIIAPPSFTIAAEAPPAKLPVTAAKTSPLDGGADAGAGTRMVSPDASHDPTPSACLDPAWMRAVTDHVRRYFYQPRGADHVAITGLVYVHFIVARDGGLLETSINKTTGQRRLNDAALDIMRLAAPLPAIPDRMHADRIEAILPMDFGGVGGHPQPTAGHCGG